MAQTSFSEAFRQFQAARAMTRIDIDPAYELSPESFTPTSGTTIVGEQTQSGHAVMVYRRPLAAHKHHDANLVSASTTLALARVGDSPSRTFFGVVDPNSIAWTTGVAVSLVDPASIAFSAGSSLSLFHTDFSDWSSGDSILGPRLGEPAELTVELQKVIDYAERQGLQQVADRFVDLARLPLDDDETPLQAGAARNFVEYCIARQKKGRPLMTVTPGGYLDATWKCSERERIVMRFFSDGSVWVAYRLLIESGSFELAAKDLLNPNLHFKIPNWA